MGIVFAQHTWVSAFDDEGPMPDGVVLALAAVAYLIAPVLWWMAYYRLKAKQA